MHNNIDELSRFYQSKLGQLVINCVENQIDKLIGNNLNSEILGFGYAAPFIERMNSNSGIRANFIPHEVGIGKWPNDAPNKTLVGNENNLPFADSSFDTIICIHGIEGAKSPKKLLRELWRVIKDEGEIIFIITNRRSAWAQFDITPFGHSRPYSKSQINRLLDESMFEVHNIKKILTFPPFSIGLSKKYAEVWEKIGIKLWPAIGGLLVLKAKKRLFGGAIVGPIKQKAKFAPIHASFLNNKTE